MLDTTKCSASLSDCIHYRRCFMTGEYCSRQANIQKARERLHAEGKINAFVIMNFSNMSDVVYKWRIKPFIESLKSYLWIEEGIIVCYSEPKSQDKLEQESDDGQETEINGNTQAQNSPKPLEKKKPVKQINVIRADTDTASNYVVCNRICQQMQMADLIVVDVSFENTNVFYEFGMAVALGKLILPICYSESFFGFSLPKKLEERLEKGEKVEDKFKRHIDCYPWRRTLFEHFGIRYRSKKDSDVLEKVEKKTEDEEKTVHITQYLEFKDATHEAFGFSDIQYRKFPYLESIKREKNGVVEETLVGESIYNRLRNTYNNSRYQHNTLIVYTLEGLLNEDQAGQCIINYYNYYTYQMKQEHCFCGDRVGTLIQSNAIPEKVKDAKTDKHLLYNVGEIIQLGVNEATYAAQKATIKTDDYLCVPEKKWTIKANDDWIKTIRTFAKGYVGNKSIAVYPKTPVYVKRIENGLQTNITEINKTSDLRYYFCLYHVMLRTLKYTNELVVDISKTPFESLFWLGAAHGSDVNCIIVRYEQNETERVVLTGSSEKKERTVFDVSGLWSAILRSHNTEDFYRQLVLAQKGIEQHSKLMLRNLPYYEELLIDGMYQKVHSEKDDDNEDQAPDRITDILKEKESWDLESYYRDRFWKPMLSGEHLRIYLPQVDGTDDERKEPKLNAVKWDVEAIATLSHYLSIRTHIGEYSYQTIGKNEKGEMAEESNFITVGNDAKPLAGKGGTTISLPKQIHTKLGDGQIHLYWDEYENERCPKRRHRLFKGFAFEGSNGKDMYFTQLPQSFCFKCMKVDAIEGAGNEPLRIITDKGKEKCFLRGKKNVHTQLAQLVLWRDVDREKNEVKLRVSITGTSGPSTLALSTILVNESQRVRKFQLDKEILTNPKKRGEVLAQNCDLCEDDLLQMGKPLSTLQNEIRGKLISAFITLLDQKVTAPATDKEKERDDCEEYAMKIKYSAVLYLTSVLYRYFLPFLSLEDEEKLLNGLRYFLFSLIASKTVPYPVVGENQEFIKKQGETKTVDNAVDALKTILHSFKGVEALYCVKVKVREEANCDSREILSIRPLEGAVNCLFVP